MIGIQRAGIHFSCVYNEMESFMGKIPLLVLFGPTASGKTKLAVEICKAFGGEVITADSMQVYKQMNIGTAKPTNQEMQGM